MATTNWWMFHGDPAHTGEVTDSNINSTTVKSLKLAYPSITTPGSILSTPAVVDGFIYVGLSNSLSPDVATGNGGTMLKIDITNGQTVDSFNWETPLDQRDSHGFAGMGCTPAVVGDFIYFIGFNGIMYCLNINSMSTGPVWTTNLRYDDRPQNQYVRNVIMNQNTPWVPVSPQAAGWSSPVVADGLIWVGIGEGENPPLMSFVYCLDAGTGKVKWVFATCKYSRDPKVDNQPNVLPSWFVPVQPVPAPFSVTDQVPHWLGCSVWSGLAYDSELGIVYASTGNPASSTSNPVGYDPGLPTPNSYAYGILALKSATGEFVAFTQFPQESSYRPTDADVDVGGAPTLYQINGRKVVGVGCKNGSYMVCDAQTLEILAWRQMLPTNGNLKQSTTNGWIATVDPHGNDTPSDPHPDISNEQSNTVVSWAERQTSAYEFYTNENFHGTYSTAATCSSQQKLFIGLGGNNYHWIAAGIDSVNTPFLRAMNWETLDDAWPVSGDPAKYTNGVPPLYSNMGESGISVPAVVNDVVFMTTTLIALYAFSATDGTLLWQDNQNFGAQTGGYSGGYGYCMGPAIWGNYVVAGALVQGGDLGSNPPLGGGCLNVYVLS